MKNSIKSKNAPGAPGSDEQVAAYAQAQPLALRAICELLRKLIDEALPEASSRVWHGSPVWFINENPVVGYDARAETVNLLFWNGQAFDEAGLSPVGKYRAAQAAFGDAAEIDPEMIRRWLRKAQSNVFDAKAFFKELRQRK